MSDRRDHHGDQADREHILALAHELRTPLTALQIGVGILDSRTLGPLTRAQEDVLATLGAEVTRLRRLVDVSLDTDRLGPYAGPSTREHGDLVDIVEAALAPIAEQAATLGISLSISGRRPQPVLADRMRLSWATAAVVGNALRYAPRDTTITVTISRRRGFAVIDVRDEGPGIPMAVRLQLDKRSSGHAFTLVMVREILEMHGGRLRVADRSPRGSSVELSLPLDAFGSAEPSVRQSRKRPVRAR